MKEIRIHFRYEITIPVPELGGQMVVSISEGEDRPYLGDTYGNFIRELQSSFDPRDFSTICMLAKVRVRLDAKQKEMTERARVVFFSGIPGSYDFHSILQEEIKIFCENYPYQDAWEEDLRQYPSICAFCYKRSFDRIMDGKWAEKSSSFRFELEGSMEDGSKIKAVMDEGTKHGMRLFADGEELGEVAELLPVSLDEEPAEDEDALKIGPMLLGRRSVGPVKNAADFFRAVEMFYGKRKVLGCTLYSALSDLLTQRSCTCLFQGA